MNLNPYQGNINVAISLGSSRSGWSSYLWLFLLPCWPTSNLLQLTLRSSNWKTAPVSMKPLPFTKNVRSLKRGSPWISCWTSSNRWTKFRWELNLRIPFRLFCIFNVLCIWTSCAPPSSSKTTPSSVSSSKYQESNGAKSWQEPKVQIRGSSR